MMKVEKYDYQKKQWKDAVKDFWDYFDELGVEDEDNYLDEIDYSDFRRHIEDRLKENYSGTTEIIRLSRDGKYFFYLAADEGTREAAVIYSDEEKISILFDILDRNWLIPVKIDERSLTSTHFIHIEKITEAMKDAEEYKWRWVIEPDGIHIY